MEIAKSKYGNLLRNIGTAIKTGRNNAFSALNEQILLTYWEIGKYIVEFEQYGKQRAGYGIQLLRELSIDLKRLYGKGFGLSNLQYMRLFYIKYPKFRSPRIYQTSGKSSKSLSRKYQTSGKLTWSHYSELLGVSDDMTRAFYEHQAARENWSVRELKRQIDAALFQRLALSKNKKGVVALSKKGNQLANSGDLIKESYVFEFLKIPDSNRMTESALERTLIDNLQNFLMELGKGFSFVARQFRIMIDNKNFRIDLVFYHRILKCFILIDLKVRKVNHTDIGQMNLYLNYFKEEENIEDDNEPIGIIIAADKHESLVKYATGGLSNKIFVSKYQLYLPDKKLLERKVKQIMRGD